MYHDSRDPLFRYPAGACCCRSSVQLRFSDANAAHVWLRLWWENKPILQEMEQEAAGVYAAAITMPEHIGLLWYYFIIEKKDGSRVYYGNAEDQLGGVGKEYAWEPPSYQITVFSPDYDTPHWMRNGIMMQIMVDRFNRCEEPRAEKFPSGAVLHTNWNDFPILDVNDSDDNQANDFFGGDLRGITEKLEYIRSLGVSVLYLNPIFRARSNHKYDTSDYMQIDPSFGTEEDFRLLCRRAEEMGIRVVLDGVFSHTGADSIYFNMLGNFPGQGAYQSKNSPYYSWYHFDRWPNAYDSWWGFPMLPNVNENEPSFREFVLGENGVMEKWTRNGASGWRLDVADELPMDFIRSMRYREKRLCPDAALIGEVWEDPSNKIAYGKLRSYCLGDTLDSTMNYPLRQAILNFMLHKTDSAALKREIDSMAEKQPAVFFYSQMNLLGSHDRARTISILADCGNMEPPRKYRFPLELNQQQYALGRSRYMAAWQLVCALPGMPCLYYGDEAGMTGMTDPFCRGTYPWGNEDIQLLECVRNAAQFRAQHAVLRTGKMRLHAPNANVLLVERYGSAFSGQENGRIILAVNRSNEPACIEFNAKKHTVPALGTAWMVIE